MVAKLYELAYCLGMIPGDSENDAIMAEAEDLMLALDQALDRVHQSYQGGVHSLAALAVSSYFSAAVVAQEAVKAPDADSRSALFRQWAQANLEAALGLHRAFLAAIRAGRMPDDNRIHMEPPPPEEPTNGDSG